MPLRAASQRRVLRTSLPPIELDVTRRPWPVELVDAVVCINMIHIAPWEATLALFAGARETLSPAETIVTYGPYLRDGRHTAPSNAAFDDSLRSRDPAWGVRDMDRVAAVAEDNGFPVARDRRDAGQQLHARVPPLSHGTRCDTRYSAPI